jgi:hypothetical protein
MQATQQRNQATLENVSAQNARVAAGSISPGMAAVTSLVGNATTYASQWDWRRRLQIQLAAPYAQQYPGQGYPPGGYS